MHLCLMILLWTLNLSHISATNDTDTSGFITSAGDLQDGPFGSWVKCGAGEDCDKRRIHFCANNITHSISSCGKEIWKEELYGCHTCNSIWIKTMSDIADQSGWSACGGTGCDDTTQTLTEYCGNMAVNTKCNRISTRYCEPSETCDGTWTAWSSDDRPCQKTCEKRRTWTKTRKCLKNGKDSSNCDNTRPSYTVTELEHCKAKPCPTTTSTAAVTTSPLETTKYTTTEAVTLSQWSEWSQCNASCEQSLGMQQRSRICEYQNRKETPPTTICSKFQLIDNKQCVLQEDIKCTSPEPKNFKTTQGSKQTTESENPLQVSEQTTKSGKAIGSKRLGIKQPQIATRSVSLNATLPSTTEGDENKVGLTKQQYHILVIALGTAASLFVVILIIYVLCGRRNKKKRRKRRKIGEISVVALESHMGFTEGMEKYGFKKSMMPTDNLLTSLHPSAAEAHETSSMIPIHANQNAHHIYEDMRLPEPEIRQPQFNSISPMRRSVSQRERQQDFYADEIMRRRSCFIDTQYATPHKKAPAKPPRRSMPQLDIPNKYEYSVVPVSTQNHNTPALDFIHNIHPPSTTPPATPQPQNTPTLNGNNHTTPSKSAPATPGNYQMGAMYATQIPIINCMSSSFLVPYSNIPMMTRMQSHSGDVIYMPSLMPIHQAQIMTDVSTSSISQTTPLHGTNIKMMREHNLQPPSKPRPHSTGVLPIVSVTDVDFHRSSEHTPSEGLLTHNIATQPQTDGISIHHQRRSFKNLHGTQNTEIYTGEEEDTNKTVIAEDTDGYVVAMREE